jgi:hypothetical protein
MVPQRLALPLLAVFAIFLPHGASEHSLGSRAAVGLAAPHLEAEAERLTAHFDSVDVELRAPAAAGLTPAQQASRGTLIGWLREYRDAGRFPRNDRYPDRAMPFFRDSDGVLCAMAYLIDRSGRGDLVDRIAATRNNAFIPELARDAELSGWLDSVGLTLAEAARVQPTYGNPRPQPETGGLSTGYAFTSMLVSVGSLATVGVNAIAPSRTATWAGLIAGSAAVVAGAARADRPGATGSVAATNLIAGAGAVAFGVYRLTSAPRGLESRVSLNPLVMPDDEGVTRYGLEVRTTF